MEDSLRRVMGPDELVGGAEALVPQGHGGVDDVLPVATHHYEPVAQQIMLITYQLHTTWKNSIFQSTRY